MVGLARKMKNILGSILILSGLVFLGVSVYLTFIDRFLASIFSMAIGFIVLGVGADLMKDSE